MTVSRRDSPPHSGNKDCDLCLGIVAGFLSPIVLSRKRKVKPAALMEIGFDPDSAAPAFDGFFAVGQSDPGPIDLLFAQPFKNLKESAPDVPEQSRCRCLQRKTASPCLAARNGCGCEEAAMHRGT